MPDEEREGLFESSYGVDWLGPDQYKGGGSEAGAFGGNVSDDPYFRRDFTIRPEWERFADQRGFASGRVDPFSNPDASWWNTPFIYQDGSWVTPREVSQTPYTPEEVDALYGRYGHAFRNLGSDVSPFTRERLNYNEAQGFPGLPRDYFPENQGRGSASFSSPLDIKPPPFLARLYQVGSGESLSNLVGRAQRGANGWTSGGPDAPRLLTPVEWDAMLPSEQDGLLGFLEYIGIPSADYMAAMRQRQQAVTQAFSVGANWKPARQR